MILPDKKIVEKDFANLTDYSLQRPQSFRSFFAFVHFTDESSCLWSNIFALTRRKAINLVMDKFSDCLEYISSINIHEQEY